MLVFALFAGWMDGFHVGYLCTYFYYIYLLQRNSLEFLNLLIGKPGQSVQKVVHLDFLG